MIKSFLQSNPDVFHKVMDSLYDGVYCTDNNRIITYWNPAAEQLTGFKAEEVLGKSCKDNILKHITEDGKNMCTEGCPLQQTICDGQKREIFAYLHHKNGHRLPVYIRTSTLMENNDVVGGIEIFSNSSMVLSLRMANERLKKMAFLDELTQLPNRRYGLQKIGDAIYNFSRYQTNFGVAIFDIDNFKRVNDTYGHDIGDKVLQMVAQSLQIGARETDYVCRWGGEEFLTIISEASEDIIQKVSERQRIMVENSFLNMNDACDSALHATVSGGVTIYKEGQTEDSTTKCSDQALYLSKENGKNRITLYAAE